MGYCGGGIATASWDGYMGLMGCWSCGGGARWLVVVEKFKSMIDESEICWNGCENGSGSLSSSIMVDIMSIR